MTQIRAAFTAVILLPLLCLSTHGGQDSWPEYRGPGADGKTTATDLPLSWSEKKNVTWKVPIKGRAWSSPVVQDDKVWLTSATPDGKELYVFCISAKNGKTIHEFKLFDVKEPQFVHKFNTHASPSPVIDGDRVYIEFGSYGTAC